MRFQVKVNKWLRKFETIINQCSLEYWILRKHKPEMFEEES